MDKFDGKAKMYLQEDNDGFGLLITDGFGHWFYWGENDLPVELTENAATNVRILQDAIIAGKMYSAKDFIDECLDREIYARHIIPRYIKAVNVNDIAAIENSECNCDFTTWYSVNKEE
jgi:hypothetical protein